mgnify:CR=1 FL=1
MAQKDNKIRPGKDMRRAGAPADKSLAVALIKLMGVGFATGLALIAGAKKVGDTYLDAKEISELPDIEDMEGMGEDDGADVEAEADDEAAGFEPEGGMN